MAAAKTKHTNTQKTRKKRKKHTCNYKRIKEKRKKRNTTNYRPQILLDSNSSDVCKVFMQKTSNTRSNPDVYNAP